MSLLNIELIHENDEDAVVETIDIRCKYLENTNVSPQTSVERIIILMRQLGYDSSQVLNEKGVADFILCSIDFESPITPITSDAMKNIVNWCAGIEVLSIDSSISAFDGEED
tara:strand:- start:9310 stop:9645 length:336 start_codon:yes stop_codon:yes gene_type:complete